VIGTLDIILKRQRVETYGKCIRDDCPAEHAHCSILRRAVHNVGRCFLNTEAECGRTTGDHIEPKDGKGR
jgi:hypothetical protein